MSEKEKKLNSEKIVGNQFNDLNAEEMSKLAGGNADVNPEIVNPITTQLGSIACIPVTIGGPINSLTLCC